MPVLTKRQHKALKFNAGVFVELPMVNGKRTYKVKARRCKRCASRHFCVIQFKRGQECCRDCAKRQACLVRGDLIQFCQAFAG